MFLDQQRLDFAYLRDAQRWFAPLAESLALHQSSASSAPPGAPPLVAVNGCQGSGKTTLCAYLAASLQAQYGLRVLPLSLDDFYLTRARRRELAAGVHPLLATRGVPGTHDMVLLNDTLDKLLAPPGPDPVPVPRFDKARDDRRRRPLWDKVEGRLDLILLEGWCLGARPQSAIELVQPVNELERREDPDAFWRDYVNEALRRDFSPLYDRVDRWVMLQAPSFACVYRWRLEQEHKLARSRAKAGVAVMTDGQVARFIEYYQRLTEHCLATVPATVDYLFTLDEERRVTASRSGASSCI
jgi:D-glycerate 3-kinase